MSSPTISTVQWERASRLRTRIRLNAAPLLFLPAVFSAVLLTVAIQNGASPSEFVFGIAIAGAGAAVLVSYYGTYWVGIDAGRVVRSRFFGLDRMDLPLATLAVTVDGGKWWRWRNLVLSSGERRIRMTLGRTKQGHIWARRDVRRLVAALRAERATVDPDVDAHLTDTAR